MFLKFFFPHKNVLEFDIQLFVRLISMQSDKIRIVNAHMTGGHSATCGNINKSLCEVK